MTVSQKLKEPKYVRELKEKKKEKEKASMARCEFSYTTICLEIKGNKHLNTPFESNYKACKSLLRILRI